jgi:hypothetical protein
MIKHDTELCGVEAWITSNKGGRVAGSIVLKFRSY